MVKRLHNAQMMRNGIQTVTRLREKMIASGAIPMPIPDLRSTSAPAKAAEPELEMAEGHCLGAKCRDESGKSPKKQFQVEGTETMKQGHSRKYGKCPDCGGGISHFVSGKQNASV